jgi:hypothetical protein
MVEPFSCWSPDDWFFEMQLSDRSKRIWKTGSVGGVLATV